MEPIGVLAPATTANLGPGFDCLGMALDLWNRIDVTSGPSIDMRGPVVEISGEGAGELETGDDNLVTGRWPSFSARRTGKCHQCGYAATTRYPWPEGWAAAPPPYRVD